MREIKEVQKEMNNIKNRVIALLGIIAITSTAAMAAAPALPDQERFSSHMAEKVRKELVTLPYYGVFDNLAFKIDGNAVTLFGQVTRPTTRKDAERRIAKVEGVTRVVNQIEVLPLSSFDNAIRARTYRAVFRTGLLYRYAQGANPSIHIVVDRGKVTLEGVVSSRADSRLAYIAANSVPGVFSVMNHLRVQNEG